MKCEFIKEYHSFYHPFLDREWIQCTSCEKHMHFLYKKGDMNALKSALCRECWYELNWGTEDGAKKLKLWELKDGKIYEGVNISPRGFFYKINGTNMLRDTDINFTNPTEALWMIDFEELLTIEFCEVKK